MPQTKHQKPKPAAPDKGFSCALCGHDWSYYTLSGIPYRWCVDCGCVRAIPAGDAPASCGGGGGEDVIEVIAD